MPDTGEIGVGMGGMKTGDFIPAEKPDVPQVNDGVRVLHIKITCQHCGTLLGHFRVEGNATYIPLQVEPCPECMAGIFLNQQLTLIKEEDHEE